MCGEGSIHPRALLGSLFAVSSHTYSSKPFRQAAVPTGVTPVTRAASVVKISGKDAGGVGGGASPAPSRP